MGYLGLNLQEQVLKNKNDIKALEEREIESPVTSVNGKTGAVVIDASDVNLRSGTHTTVESNINRIDLDLDAKEMRIETLEDTVGNLHHETWTFTLDNDTEVNKEVVLWI